MAEHGPALEADKEDEIARLEAENSNVTESGKGKRKV